MMRERHVAVNTLHWRPGPRTPIFVSESNRKWRPDVIRSKQRSISTRVPAWRGNGALLAAVAGLVLTISSPVLAQSLPAPIAGAETPSGDAGAPAREANIYDHRDHQPTEAEVGAAEAAAGIREPSSASRADVEKDVEDLLNQADRLDQQAEEQDQGRL
jgi:hypothetical protein